MNKQRCVHTLLVEAQHKKEVGGNSIIANKKYKREALKENDKELESIRLRIPEKL